MKRIVVLGLCVLASASLAADDLPKRFGGTWKLDRAASKANLSEWDASAADKGRFSRELEGMEGAALILTPGEVIFEEGGRKDAEPVRVISVAADALVLEDLAGRGRFTFRLLGEILLMESTGAPPMAFSRGPAAGSEGSSPSDVGAPQPKGTC